MSTVLLAIMVVPLAGAITAWLLPSRAGAVATVASGTATFGLCLALVPAVAADGGTSAVAALGGWLRADSLSMVFLIATAFLYALTAVFAVGYVAADPSATRLYSRRLYAGLNLFAWAMAMAPVVNNLGLLWVAIEVTTVVSALLVAMEGTDAAIEAAWKYILLASLGLGLSLLATAVIYHAGSYSLGQSYDLSYSQLLAASSRFPAGTVRLAYLLAVLGFGTKVGLFPVHTWLPDAHSEAPTPVSALLSGSLLATSFYAILRYYQVTQRVGAGSFARDVLAGFGVATLLLGALYLASQRDLKRLLAYSSIEHMGIIAIGVSFASPLAIAGALLHVLAHAAAKGTSFFGAGSVVRKLRTKDLERARGAAGLLPWSGPMLVAGMLGLSGMPPFGTFRSELSIVAGGLSGGPQANTAEEAIAAVLVVLATAGFLGLSWHLTRAVLSPGPTSEGERGEASKMIVVAMALGLAGLVVLGAHPPAQLSQLFQGAAGELGVRR
ncbi:MAG TPA: proton-conducting transporter membrane subunit [Acidimicrobiales bacterium]|nr:proton-conducting transporter membrane subunit [Acidimicrobiales bacterium]